MEGRRAGDVGSALSKGRAYTRLRPGPGQRVDQVASHQRLRLLQAMLDLAVDEGYESTTVRGLSRLAGVSTASFYARFDGKEECFLAACSSVLDRIQQRVSTARAHHEDEHTQLTRTVEAFLAEPTADPDTSRIALLDAFGAGPAALGQMLTFETSLEVEIENNLSRRGTSPPKEVVSWITAGCLRACRSLLTKDGDEGKDLAERLAMWGKACLDSVSAQTSSLGIRGDAVSVETSDLPGPHRFDERATILAAVTKLAISRGYWGLRVSDIRRQAGISRAAFDLHFSGVDDCYLAASTELARSYLSAMVLASGSTPEKTQSQVGRAATALARRLAAEPEKARLAFIGVLDPGPQGLRRRERLITELARSWSVFETPGETRNQFWAETTLGAFWNAVARRLHDKATPSLVDEASLLASLLAEASWPTGSLDPQGGRNGASPSQRGGATDVQKLENSPAPKLNTRVLSMHTPDAASQTSP